MRSQFKYTRAFNKWKREFAASAKADNYVELLRPIEHLGKDCSKEDMMACTILLVRAVMGYCQMDGRECGGFLKQQYYHPDGRDEVFYSLTFDLSGVASSHFGRILTDINLTYVDFEDLFNHAWTGCDSAGFTEVYITRLDGKRIGKRELKRLNKEVTSDMYYGYNEQELSVDVYTHDFIPTDTAYVYATETDEYDWDAFDLHTIRAARFATRFGD
jgi:hypothetical protein